MLSPKKPGGRPVAVGVGAGSGFVGGVGEVAVATFTDVEADFVGSALLIAVTVSVPAVAGAVYWPVDVILPSTARQVTLLFVVVPDTAAVNGSVPDGIDDAVIGDIVTDVTVCGAVGLALTCAEFALSPLVLTAETT